MPCANNWPRWNSAAKPGGYALIVRTVAPTHEREDFLDAESRTQRELAAVRKRLEQAERVAEQARRELQESGKAQSQAEVARQGKGRLARLLAA